MMHAEKNCRKLRTGEVPFSDQLVTVGMHIKLWGLVVRHKKGRNINTRYLRRVAKRCKVRQPLKRTLKYAILKKKTAWKHYKKAKRHAARLRAEFLSARVEAAVSPLVKRQIQNIIKHEDTRRSWRAINKARGKTINKVYPQ